MKTPSKKTKVDPKKPMTIKYTPPELEMDVCTLLYNMIENHKVKHILSQMYACTIMEGMFWNI